MSRGEEARVSAIVLAAGESRRMGPGKQKLLMGFGGRTVIECVIAAIDRSTVRETIVVTGSHHGQISDVLKRGAFGVRFARNPDPARGMLSSVRWGLMAVDPKADGVAVFPGDQPGVSGEVIETVIGAWRRSPAGIAVPTFGGRRGHPLVFDARYCEEIHAKFDDTGLRGLLAAHPGEVLEVPLASSAILEDIDTPEEYRRLSAAAKRIRD